MISQLADLKNTPANTPGPHCMIISPSRSNSFVESWPSAAHAVMSESQRAQELRKYVPFPAPSYRPNYNDVAKMFAAMPARARSNYADSF